MTGLLRHMLKTLIGFAYSLDHPETSSYFQPSGRPTSSQISNRAGLQRRLKQDVT